MAHVMTLKDLRNYAISLALGSAVVFGVGHQSTIDAIIATVVWLLLVFGMLAIIISTIALFVIGRATVDGDTRKAAAPFYKGLSEMHKGPVARVISFLLSAYWMYGFIIHEWTVTAVVYVIQITFTYIFLFLSKDAVKEFFVDSLKGDTA